MIESVTVLGLGKIGRLAAELLTEAGFDVIGVDQRQQDSNLAFETRECDVSSREVLADLAGNSDAVLSCLPYNLNIAVAEAAHAAETAYFDLTEDTSVTQRVGELAESSTSLMVPQCGLAPGYVGIVAADLAAGFQECRSLRLRVGALPLNPTGHLGYAFNWSPEGVVNEYLNDAEVIEDGVHKWVSSMEWVERIFIDGNELEAFTTSGGLGTICDTYLGKIANIDYKTIRYPGHVDLMNFFFHELLMREDRETAGKILTRAKPPVEADVVYIHVAAEGDRGQGLVRSEYVRSFTGAEILGSSRTAIAWTTASSVAAVVELAAKGRLGESGFVRQEAIALSDLLGTVSGARFASVDRQM